MPHEPTMPERWENTGILSRSATRDKVRERSRENRALIKLGFLVGGGWEGVGRRGRGGRVRDKSAPTANIWARLDKEVGHAVCRTPQERRHHCMKGGAADLCGTRHSCDVPYAKARGFGGEVSAAERAVYPRAQTPYAVCHKWRDIPRGVPLRVVTVRPSPL
jgi:hypothetical protein